MNKETLKGWKQYRLNDLFIINPPKDNISNDTEVSFIAMKDVSDAGYLISSEVKRFEEVKNGYTYFKNDDIILAKITPCFENGKMAVLSNLTNNYGVGSTEFYVFRKRPNANILPQILYYIFKEPSFRKNAIMHMSGAAGQKRVQRKFLEYYPLSIPLTTAEQQEIVQVLDTMSNIIRLREECISHAQELISSLFIEIFRDPIKNDKNYKTYAIKSLGKVTTGMTPSSSKENMFGGNIPFVTPGDLETDGDKYNRYLTEEGALNSRIVRAGSTLVCCIGATIGKVDIAKIKSCFNQQINAIEWNHEDINDVYALYLFRLLAPLIKEKASNTTLPILNKRNFENIFIPKPDIKIQEQFAQKAIEIESYIKEQQEELANAKQMFQSLLHHAFTGELTRRAYEN